MVGPCNSAPWVCPTLGLSRFWYGLPPWPSALWAWRRQVEFGSSYPSRLAGSEPCPSITRVSPAYYTELRAIQMAKQQAVPKTGIQSILETVQRLWPFRWPVATPVSPPISAPVIGPPPPGHLVDQFM